VRYTTYAISPVSVKGSAYGGLEPDVIALDRAKSRVRRRKCISVQS
jgi:hypothetical protein